MPRTLSSTLLTVIAGDAVCQADLWTVEPSVGAQHWTTADSSITIGGTTWAATAPVIQRGPIRMTTGVETSTLDFTLKGSFMIGGVTISALAATGSFDDAKVTLERLYLPTWDTTPDTDHKMTPFIGFISEIEPTSTTVKFTAKSILTSAEEELPRRQLGPMCPFTWGDSLTTNRCTIVKASYAATDTINATGTTALVIHLVTGTSGNIRAGSTIEFSTGMQKVIRDWDSSGKLATLDSPLPAVPSGSVTIWKGCFKTQADCNTSYTNLVHFGGFPYLPI